MTHPIVRDLARCALHARGLHPAAEPVTVGRITLLPHQTAAVQWLQHRITRYGGALLADPPGLGKTYVALAIAELRKVRPLVIAPAGLRRQWHEAADATGTPIDFISTERLSAPAAAPATTHDFIIIDEAHHLRTASTRRYQRTATLCITANVLLLTATPIHNRSQDLERITSLFHLPVTRQTPRTLRRLTLRRTIAQIHAAGLTNGQPLSIPAIALRGSFAQAPRTDDITDSILSLPAIDDTARDAHRLLQLGLLHALRSSDAACRARVRNRIAGTIAIEEAARAAVEPSAAIRRAFTTRDGDIQLAMTQLLGQPSATTVSGLAWRAAAQREALRALLPRLDSAGDKVRATALRRLARWCRHPVVAFTQFTATAEAFYRELRQQPGIALLSGTQARIASGVVSRSDVLGRLLSSDRRHHRAVRLLITTDVLSEGLSLSGVATIVHLDLPWTAARIDQRIGRAARIGTALRTVSVISLPARVPADLSTRLHSLLESKRRAMRDFAQHTESDVAHIRILRRLAGDGVGRRSSRWVTLRSLKARHERIIALVRTRGRTLLLVAEHGRLRAPCTDDWCAMLHTTRTRARSGAPARLRAAVMMDAAERELCDVVYRAGDHRLQARRLLDDRMLTHDHARRIATAHVASLSRAAAMQPTRAAGVAALARTAAGAEAGAEVGAMHGVLPGHPAHDHDDAPVRVRAAVVLVPA